MIPLFNAQQSKELDQQIIAEGTPGLLLMKRAAWHLFACARAHYPQTQRWLILCGPGNNGGDGLACAQFALLAGLDVSVFLTDEKMHGDALSCLNELKALNTNIRSPVDLETFSQELGQTDLLIDALFGIGLNRPLKQENIQLIETINAASCPVISADLPSGLDADSGKHFGNAIKAEHTCTFLTRKIGLYTHLGPDFCGQIHYFNLHTNPLLETSPVASSHELNEWRQRIPTLRADNHKGSMGRVLLIGGHQNMMGAIQLSASACLHGGAGLTKVISDAQHLIPLTQQQPELMCYPPEKLDEQLQQSDLFALGPGLGLDDWGARLYQNCMQNDLPRVLDADALKWLAKMPTLNPRQILTPHPGEAAILLDSDSQSIQQDRVGAIKAIQKKYGGVVILKGKGSLIYDGNRLELCPLGNPGMAVGGMGDVLTGVVAALWAKGMTPFDAACAAVYIHAAAADECFKETGAAGLIPSLLPPKIGRLIG
ncbi:NAD(P)H-hydrate dehydratase [Thiomicrorhabdus sp.]|uniref:NAD(P)H-hydrate dehydratase n=1 Tax=Thiomicrorhabdus sp. TaxID=2039724 RepID=UPI0029C967AC|nr:NAD(P)H-hydrate dehydratase [Thiomicrorhabdus sp.]